MRNSFIDRVVRLLYSPLKLRRSKFTRFCLAAALLGAGTVTVAERTIPVDVDSDYPIILFEDTHFEVKNATESYTFSGPISGNFFLGKVGNGELWLSTDDPAQPHTNTYTGGTRLEEGTLGLDSTGALGVYLGTPSNSLAGTLQVTGNGTTLATKSDLSLSNLFLIGDMVKRAGSVTLDIRSAKTFTISGVTNRYNEIGGAISVLVGQEMVGETVAAALSFSENGNLVLENNKAEYGGAVGADVQMIDRFVSLDFGKLSSTRFLSNTAKYDGGGLFLSSTAGTFLTMGDNTTFTGNESQEGSGGAIYFSSDGASEAVLGENTLFDGNSAFISGGAIYATHDLTVRRNTLFRGNTTLGSGGAISVNGFGTVNTLTFDATGGAIAFMENTVGNTASAKSNSVYLDRNTELDLFGNGNIYFDDPISTGAEGGNFLTKTGGGFVQFVGDNILNPDGKTNGNVTVSDGEFRVVAGAGFSTGGGTGQNFDVKTGAVLAGGGTIVSENGFVLSGTISPDNLRYAIPDFDETTNRFGATKTPTGTAVGTLRLTGNTTIDGATLAVDIASKDSYDQIAVTGTVAISGTNTVDFRLGSWQTGTFDLVTSTGAMTGTGTFTVTHDLGDKDDAHYGKTVAVDASGKKLQLTLALVNLDLTWTGASDDGLWNVMTSANWTNAAGTTKLFANGDTVTFVDLTDTRPHEVTVTSGGVGVGGMSVGGTQDWTFSGGGITGTGDFTKTGTGSVKFENATEFTNYRINAGTLATASGVAMNGNVILADIAMLNVESGTVIDGVLTVTGGSTLEIDMTGASATDVGLTVDSFATTGTGTFNIDLTGVGAIDGTYLVIDTAGNFDFKNTFVGTIDGQPAPVVLLPNERYGKTEFDTKTLGRLNVVVAGADDARTATWDGGSGTWNETAQNWTLGGSALKYFKAGDSVVFGGTTSGNRAITVAAYGTATSIGVEEMTVSGTNSWTFSGHDIIGSGDFTKNGTGSVTFENTTKFAHYRINAGTLATVAGVAMTGDVRLAGEATMDVDYGTVVTGDLFADGGTLAFDMAGATKTGEALAVDDFDSTDSKRFNVDLSNVGTAEGTYCVILTAGTFDFTGKFSGTINGTAGPILAGPNERYGKTDFDTETLGRLDVVVTGEDVSRTATWDGGSGTWNETAQNWTLGGSALKYFKAGDSVVFGGTTSGNRAITVAAYGTATSIGVAEMTVSGTNDWTFSGHDIIGSGDFTMNGTGSVTFENATEFSDYRINAGTLATVAGVGMTGDVILADIATLNVESGTVIDGVLTVTGGSTLEIDMSGTSATAAALTVDSFATTGTGTFDVDLTGVDAADGTYLVIDTAGTFDFENAFAGTIDGQSTPIVLLPNERYGKTEFDTRTLGRLNLVVAGADISRTAVWDGGSGIWNETAQKWTLGGSTSKYFKAGDSVVFGGTASGNRSITVAAYGSATSIGVAGMSVSGTNAWTFSGHDIIGSGDFTMTGTGSVKFNNATKFAHYRINGGTLQTVADADMTGDVILAAAATMDVDYGTILTGGLAVTGGSTLDIDMSVASSTGTALAVDAFSKTGTAAFNVNLTGVGAINGSYTVIDAGTNFDFTGTVAGTINGQTLPTEAFPNERYGKTDFDTTTPGRLAVKVSDADILRTATFTGTDGAWNETSKSWSLTGADSKYFKSGDAVIFSGSDTRTVTVSPTAPETTMLVAGMTVSGGGEWTFTGSDILGRRVESENFGNGKLSITGDRTVAVFFNEIDFEGGIEIEDGAKLGFIYSGSIVTNDNDISGGGGIVKAGDGELVLPNANSYEGGTHLAAGTLTVKDKSALGTGAVTVANDTTLKLDFDGEFTNEIDGTANVEAAGRVIVNRTTDVDMFVTGFLGGTAQYGSLTVKNGGTLAPGNPTGTVTVTGGATFETGSTYEYEIDTTGKTIEHDLLVVEGGDVDIESGARLEIKFLSGSTAEKDDRFLVIDADKGQFRNDTYFDLIGTWRTSFTQSIESDGYWIHYSVVDPEFAKTVRRYATPNGYRTAVGMDGIVAAGLQNKVSNLFGALADMPDDDPAGLAAAFGQLHGEAYASAREAATRLQRHFVQNLPSARHRTVKSACLPCDEIDGVPATSLNLWGTFTGDWINRHGIDGFSGYKLNTAGVMVGADRTIGRRAFAGIAFGYDNTTQDFKTISARNEMDAFRVMGYGGLRRGTWYADGYAGYTNDRHEMKRGISFAGFDARARSKFSDNMFSTGFEIGRKMRFGLMDITPNLGLHYIYLDSPSVTENGAGDANLHVRGGKFDSLRLPVGARLSRDFSFGTVGASYSRITWTPEVRAFYVAELADDFASVRTSFRNVRNIGFQASGGGWGRSSGVFGAGLKGRISDRVSLRVDYDHEVYEHTDMGEASVSASVNW